MRHKCYMAKVDIEATYRHVPIDPADWDKLDFRWPTDSDTDLYVDGYLQFGLMNACEVFNRIGRAIVRMMACKGFKCLVVSYVDDFFIICPDQATTWYAYWALRALLKRLGFSVNPKPHKLIPPCQILEFLGVTLDSINMQARLSPQKLAETLSLIHQTLQRPTITHRSLKRLNGKLNWICKIVYGGRTFLRRLIDAQWATSRPHHHIRISASLRQDLDWWREILPIFNGQTELIPSRPLSFNDFSIDASTSYGYGAFLQGGYFSLSFAQAARIFPDSPEPSAPIYIHELFVVLILCRLFPSSLSGRHIRLFIDNTIVVAAVNKGTAKGLTGPQMMVFLREISWLSAIHNFRLTSQYIPSKSNTLSDSLSRGDFETFQTTLLDWKLGRHQHLVS